MSKEFKDDNDNGEIVLYNSDDGLNVQVRIQDDSVWLSQQQISELYQSSRTNIVEHIRNIYKEGELTESSTCRNFRQVQNEGNRTVERNITFYNLDMIISVGYRVKSAIATKFRIWATQRLRDYIVKGFLLNDQKFKNAGNDRYFEELLQRIRDIRSSEKVFWRKVLDIFSTSCDYDSNSKIVQEFFKIIQNKMHFAAHGLTASEVIYTRVDSDKKNVGLTNFTGTMVLKRDVEIAKNYLHEDELNILNRIVMAALETAEIKALGREKMYMKDWVIQIDKLLTVTGRKLLTNSGKISHEKAIDKAHSEYEKYRLRIANEETEIERRFLEATKNLKKLEQDSKKKKK